SAITSGPIPSPGRQITLCAMELLSGQVEHVTEELGDAARRDRSLVCRLELDDELFLTLGIAQRDPLGTLVLVQRAHEREPLVDRGEERSVGGRDLLAVVADRQAVTPSSASSASTSASISTTEPVSCSATAWGVFRPVPVTSATTRSSSPITPAAAAARSAPTVTPTAVSPKTP